MTDYFPKVLLPVLNRPLLINTFRYLKKFGVDRVAINTHHLAEQIEDFIRNSALKLEVFINREEKILGTAGGVGGLRDFITEENFIIYNGDIVTNINIEDVFHFHMDKKTLMTLVLHDNSRFNKVAVDDEGRVVDIEGRFGFSSPGRPLFAFTGIAIAHKRLFDMLRPDEFRDMKDVWIDIIRNEPGALRGFMVRDHYWLDIGTPRDYLDLHRDILVSKKEILIDFDLPEGSVFIGANTSISEKARLSGFVSIGNNCRLDECKIENCVVLNNTHIRSGRSLRDSIIGPTFLIEVKV